MSDILHLDHNQSVQKVKDMAERADICFFTTALTELPLSTRPMSTQKVENDGSLWFFSEKDSDKNQHIERDNRVQLFYSNKGSSEYLSLYGKAAIMQDAAKAKELWSPWVKTWFDGPDDPELTLIKIVPEQGYYWDTKDGKIVSMLKMAAGAITGKELDGSIEGKIRI
ncbi:MAG TPA: pyridoxamine 5'-phosphate oxidase family protein [Chitinophagaceae bacterium]|nr:pyridoxamine 5'-phosphate oxidase family protein [Chitinophagaceae bacterium]